MTPHSLLFVFLTLLSICCQSQTFEVHGYGSFLENQSLISIKNSGFNKAIIEADTILTINQDSFDLKLGVEFGIVYTVEHEENTIHLIVEWDVPPQQGEQDRKLYTWEYAVEVGKDQILSIALDNEEDLIPGWYNLTARYSEHGVYKKSFYLKD
ncbi:MAG: DUF3859 domain-containing protein [Flavobacteriales bacterium]|nr:DUF3859 domain-containing protein [Flavobacteriales bacterium]